VAKRIFDILISAIALLLLAPMIGFVAALIRKKLGKPILFEQLRPGLEGQPFRMIKFRTMTDGCDSAGNLLPDNERLPLFGHWLRASSMDELPELWNVLKGNMSMVGPRPLLMHYLSLYSNEQSRRHQVKPGLTGWAQVNGRNALSWEEKFKLDIWYVDNRSFCIDIKILYLTVLKVIRRDGINASSDITMPLFTGSQGNKPLD
jgi:lipopolysaccharide/colanic/teichoic acid biosynthesis glycosyltransferase